MADRWYYAHDENKMGPFSGRQLRDLVISGQILRTDTIWKEGFERGVLATRVKNLFLPADTDIPSGSAHSSPAQPASSFQPPASSPSPEACSPVVPPAAPPASSLMDIPDDIMLQPETETAAPPPRPAPPPKKVKKGRAVAVKGAVIVGQDGISAKYRKKCSTCGHEDSSWNTLRIANGVTRLVYFCPKCRKKRDVEIQCSVQ